MSRLVPLGEIAAIFNGKTPAKTDHRIEGFPVLKIKDVDENGRFRGKCASFVDRSLAEKYRHKWIEQNDILILNAAHNANYVASKIFFAGGGVCGLLPTGEWLLIRTTARNVLPRYVDHWVRTENARQAVRFIVKGIHLYPKDVAQLEIPLPPLDEQRRIVGLLDRAAEIRRSTDAARAKARAIIPALFLDTFGDPATNPKGWPVVSVGDLRGVELRNGISPSKTGRVIGNVLTLSAITRGSFDPDARKESMFAASLADDQTVSRSLFLICRGNGNRHLVGQGVFPTFDMPGVAFPDTMIALRIPESLITPAYLAAVWSSSHLRAQIDAAAKTTNGTFKISQSAILRFSFPLPPPELQTAFAEQAQRLEALARALDTACAKAEALAAGLSAEVFGAGERKEAVTADGSLAPC